MNNGSILTTNFCIHSINNRTNKIEYSTKKLNKFDFSEICSLPNFNVINSKPTEKLANYGSLQYINMLKEKYGYDICPCGIEENLEKEKICMNTCKLCLSSQKVAFLQH